MEPNPVPKQALPRQQYRQLLVQQIALSESIARRVRRDLDHRKLLEFLIDEQEEKYIELVEGTRSHIAQIDNYLKRLAIALEDGCRAS